MKPELPAEQPALDFVAKVRALMQHFREAHELDGRIDLDGAAYRITGVCEGKEPAPEDFGHYELNYGMARRPDPRWGGYERLMNSGVDHLVLRAGADRMDVGLIRTDEGWPERRATAERALIAGA